MTRRSREEFEAFFDGLELVEPGVVHPCRLAPPARATRLEGEPRPPTAPSAANPEQLAGAASR